MGATSTGNFKGVLVPTVTRPRPPRIGPARDRASLNVEKRKVEARKAGQLRALR